MENTALQLSDLKVSNLPELQGWKEKQEQLVSENPYVEITDNKTYEVACKSRTALLKGRTELEKQEKLIVSKLTAFRKDINAVIGYFIDITEPHEDKQQQEVKRYENIKAQVKAEEERIERERIEKIKTKIDLFESDSYKIIQETNIENVEMHKTMLDAFVNDEFDYEEYDIMFEQARMRIQASWDAKCGDIQEKEEQRKRNEQLEKENLEAKRISDLQASRLNEILPYVAFGEAVDLTSLSDIEESAYAEILSSKKALFEADAKEKKEAQEKLDAENLERENKAKADKEKIFEIRVKRLEEIGIHNQINDDECTSSFADEFQKIHFECDEVLNADAIDFETIITDAKLAIEKAKEEHERAEQQKAKDLELSKADAECLKKENKARVKRLAKEKDILSDLIKEEIDYLIDIDVENKEIIDFIENANIKIHSFATELLTELEKL
jgi:hypothetical protein